MPNFNFARNSLSVFLFAMFFVLAGIPFAQAQSLPGDHGRWIGTLEGSMVDSQGSGLVYDFQFKEDGTVDIEKSMTVRKLKQTFNWSMEGSNIVLSGDASGPIGELSDRTITYIDDTRYEFKHVDGETDVEIRKSKPFWSWMHLVFLFIILMVGNEISRYYKGVSYLLYFILPIVLIPHWMKAGFDGWFRWIKLYSAVAGSVFTTFFRFHNIDGKTWAKFVVMLILAINIAEAVLQDFSQPDLPNIINGIAGVLCMVTISRWKGVKKDEQKPHDMLWPGMTTFWILAYDVWNITFVYINFPNTVAFSFIVLLAPTVAAIWIKKGTYLQARAFTLAIYMMYLFSFKAFADNSLGLTFVIPMPRSENLVLIMALVSLAFNVVYFVLHYRWRFTGKAPANLEVGQSESVL
ncbi:DUF5692 family protein [Cognataquiflexum aquatile]|uniref:DUF5692 family protein n=1 Tax=Cognataquiflexum aquatile TaxID=2249427 RepID=UPI000DEAAECA|nr:DUF5692 family protein [Cognataquiflexum aquatile]